MLGCAFTFAQTRMRYLFILLAALGCDAGGTSSDPVEPSDTGVSDVGVLETGVIDMSSDAPIDVSFDANPPAQWPAWRKGLMDWEWHELANTSLSAVSPTVLVSGQPDADGVGIAGAPHGGSP